METAATGKDRTISEDFVDERTGLLYLQAPISNITVFTIALLFYGVLESFVDSPLPEIWLAALYTTAGLRLALWAYRKNCSDRFSSQRWLQLYRSASALVGISWSLIIPLVYIANDLTVAIALCMLVFGVVASAVVILSIDLPAFLFYTYPQILTLAGTLSWYRDTQHVALGLAALVYLVMTSLFTRNIHRNHLKSLELQTRNQGLIHKLSQEVDNREQLVRRKTAELQKNNDALTREIQERRDIEAALRASEHRLSAFFGLSPAGMAMFDTQFRYLMVNETLARMHGLTREENVGKSLSDVLRHNASAVEGLFRQVVETRRSITNLDLSMEVPGKPGEISHFTVSYFPIPGPADSIQGIGAVIIDITERKQAEEALRKSEERFELAMRGANEGMFDWNLVEHSIYYSPRWKSMLGYADDEVKDDFSVWENLVDPADRVSAWNMLNDYIEGRRDDFHMEFKMRHKDGHWVDVLSRAFLVRDDAGRPVRVVGTHVDISEKKRQEERIVHQAHYDELTQLPNRFLAMDRLSQLLKESGRNGRKVAVLFLDLDGFKRINDTLGHETGDKLLIQTAQRLASSVRETDSVCRLGGDEFIVLAGDLTKASDVSPVASNLIAGFRRPFALQGRELIVTISIGIAVFPDDGDTPAELLSNADTAMYHTKELGRNNFHFFTTAMNRVMSRRLQVEEQLHGALKRGEFSVLYQPILELETGAIRGAEALLRWSNPSLGEVAPDEFIPVAEQTGVILEIGVFVLQQALQWAAVWRSHCRGEFRMAVNLSPRQFRDPELMSSIKTALLGHDLPNTSLTLEITEGVLMSGHDHVAQLLDELNRMGVGIAMDDFGTGYSSLSYLRRFPFDTLKIDRSFINDIATDPGDRELVNAAILMGHGLGLKVLAEGVETEDQLDYLSGRGCDYAQGYFFDPPLDGETFTERLQH